MDEKYKGGSYTSWLLKKLDILYSIIEDDKKDLTQVKSPRFPGNVLPDDVDVLVRLAESFEIDLLSLIEETERIKNELYIKGFNFDENKVDARTILFSKIVGRIRAKAKEEIDKHKPEDPYLKLLEKLDIDSIKNAMNKDESEK